MWRCCRRSSRLQRCGRHESSRISPCNKREIRATDSVPQTLVGFPMHILLLGSGGREHALAWKIAASPLVTKLWCAPGNAGISREAECVPLDITNHAAVIDFCRTNAVDFVVVGPDAPIAAGIVDDLNAAGFKAFGPTKAAGRLESSKQFTKARRRRSSRCGRASPRSRWRLRRITSAPSMATRARRPAAWARIRPRLC